MRKESEDKQEHYKNQELVLESNIKLIDNILTKSKSKELMTGNPFLLKLREELAKLSEQEEVMKDTKIDEVILLENPLAKAGLLELPVGDKSLIESKKKLEDEEGPKLKKQRTN